MTLTIVPRAAWGARYAPGSGPAPLPAREVWLHHSVTIAPDLAPPFDDEDAAMRLLELIGQQRFGQGVSYTFAVMPTGRVYEGHGVARLGAHTKGRNSIARAIVLVGNYDVDTPSDAQVAAVAELLVHGVMSGWWTVAQLAGGHQQAPGASTGCPGTRGMAAIPSINNLAAAVAAGHPVSTQEDDMYGDAQRFEVVSALGEITGNTRASLSADARNEIRLERVIAALNVAPVNVDELAAKIAPKLAPAAADAVAAAVDKLGTQTGFDPEALQEAVEAALRGFLIKAIAGSPAPAN